MFGYYDDAGRLTDVEKDGGILGDVGSESAFPRSGSRTYTINYDPQNRISGIIDPMSGDMGYTYDLAGRVIQEILPDNRVINYGYDAKGNVTGVTPPGRPVHEF
jgi:YD repeat-containing protein